MLTRYDTTITTTTLELHDTALGEGILGRQSKSTRVYLATGRRSQNSLFYFAQSLLDVTPEEPIKVDSRLPGDPGAPQFLFVLLFPFPLSDKAGRLDTLHGERRDGAGDSGCWIGVAARSLRGSTADEEPLVYGAVDLLGGEVLVGGDGGQLVGADAAGGVGHGQVGTIRELALLCPLPR